MFKIFKNYPNIKLGLSTKQAGPIELAKIPKRKATNRQAFLSKKRLAKVALALQSHSNISKVVLKTGRVNSDGLVTHKAKLVLVVTVADCFPIYFYDPKQKKVAIVHSGWRGTLNKIAINTVRTMKASPKDLIVGIGPGIKRCHFEIKKDILKNFELYPKAITEINGKIFVDLPKIIKSQLKSYGVSSKNIEVSKSCTFCEKNKYFSFRRDKPSQVQAMLAYISLN